MKKILIAVGALTALASLNVLGASLGSEAPEEEPWGDKKDVAFAEKLWKAMHGYTDWKLTTGVFRGASPHGKQVRLYSTWVTVDEKHYPMIVKDNFGGRGVTPERIAEDPAAWLKSVTIMLQREAGYDAENGDWFWVKYATDGTIEKGKDGRALAGRVSKGQPKGCIACHSQADGGDFLFSNDE